MHATHMLAHTQLKKDRKISLNTDSPVHTRNPASPLVNFRRDSSPSMVGGAALTPVGGGPLPTVNVVYNDDPQALDRQGIIDITADVQNFLAAISRLKQAMEDADSPAECEGMVVVLCVCVCVSAKV